MSGWTGLAGLVLVGGASRRMGRDKATLTGLTGAVSRSTTLVARVVATVAQRCAPVFVVAAPGQSLPELPAEIVYDDAPGCGPLAATGRGLLAARAAGCRYAFVCAVDMPLLCSGLIDELASLTTTGADIALPWDGRDHYLAAVYRTDLADRVEALIATGERRMGALVDAVDVQRLVVADPEPLTNVNTPADLAALTDR